LYECADGRYLALGSLEPKFFHEVLRAVDRPDLMKLPMVPGPAGEPLRTALTVLFKSKTRDEWERQLAHLDTCASGIYSLEEVLQNEQVRERGMIEIQNGKPAFALPIQFSHAKATSGPSPKLGADNDSVFS
jgi:crotonobetainyl-CoA:carnitine CoA-transferase CaiB-like acyl-CoA transferase